MILPKLLVLLGVMYFDKMDNGDRRLIAGKAQAGTGIVVILLRVA